MYSLIKPKIECVYENEEIKYGFLDNIVYIPDFGICCHTPISHMCFVLLRKLLYAYAEALKNNHAGCSIQNNTLIKEYFDHGYRNCFRK